MTTPLCPEHFDADVAGHLRNDTEECGVCVSQGQQRIPGVRDGDFALARRALARALAELYELDGLLPDSTCESLTAEVIDQAEELLLRLDEADRNTRREEHQR